MKTPVSIFILCAFLINTFEPLPAQAQELILPVPGKMVHLSPAFNPPVLKGLKVHPDNPFRFDFILDKGDDSLPLAGRAREGDLKDEANKLIKYFLASLTVPESDLWVNLSPYEKDRIVPQSFGLTEMGRDLLAQDYLLKQITASLIYPEDEFGKKFWNRVYQEAGKKFGTTNIPVNTFNKVWIVPEKAVVYENASAGTAYVVESKLKVMLEQDYLAMEKSVEGGNVPSPSVGRAREGGDVNALGSQIVREIVIPQLTKEINKNKNFSQLRQVYNSLILATWYKKKIKDSILSQVYSDKNKVKGLSSPNALIGDPGKGDVEGIYQRYLQAFKKGVYNYIKEDTDLLTQQIIPRKYFSGGVQFNLTEGSTDLALVAFQVSSDSAMAAKALIPKDRAILVGAQVNAFDGNKTPVSGDQAMTIAEEQDDISDWHITYPSITVKATEMKIAKAKRERDEHAGTLFVNGFLLASSPEEVQIVFSRITGRQVSLDNLTKDLLMSFHEEGTNKNVFKVVIKTKDGQDIKLKLALKAQIKDGSISEQETIHLELLSDSTDAVPHYGGRYHLGKEDFYLEEFIEGPTIRQLRE